MIRILALLAFTLASVGLAEARTWRVDSGPEATTRLASALASAQPGDSIRLGAGRIELGSVITLPPGVALRGDGPQRSILSFSQAAGPNAAISVTGAGASIESLGVENAPGDGLTALNCSRLSVRGVRVAWSGPRAGAVGVRVSSCVDVLLAANDAQNAGVAAFALSRVRNAVVQGNVAALSGAGVLIEGGGAIDVLENTISRNGAGLVIATLPDAPLSGVRVVKNSIRDDNGAPPADAAAPGSVGVAILGARSVFLHDNEIAEHGGVNVFVAAYSGAITDTSFSPLPQDIAIVDNKFGRAGFAPQGMLADAAHAGAALPDILWDGATTYIAGGTPHAGLVRLYIHDNHGLDREPDPTYLSLGLVVAGGDVSAMTPDNALPGGVEPEEPRAVRLPQN